MPPRAKKAAAHDRANTHHNHSLGLAAPGRPIPKSKSSNPNLTAQHTNAPSRKSTPDSPLSPLDSSVPNCPTLANGTAIEIADPAAQMYPLCRTRVASGPVEGDTESLALSKYKHTTPLRIDVNTQGGSRLPRQQKSRMGMATTILTSCPLWDVVAILIVLLQLPPTIITIIHFLFAMITFVPSSATTSLSNLPTIHEILVGSAGSPSIQTIIMVDLLMFLLFIPLWTPAQNVALDLAQAVIAISLGGAAASKGGTTNSVFWCVVLIILSHIMRWRSVRQLGVNLVWSGLIKYGFQPSGSPPQLSEYSDRLYTVPAWPRCILGVHILAQGVLRMVRRYLLWRQAQVDVAITKQKSDSDLTSQSPASGTPRSSSISPIPNSESGLNASSDGRPPGPPPGKDRSSSKIKKRKHSQHARMQQPFWAALAHTKVTVSKEYEQTQISQDAKVAGSADAKSIGSTDFKSLQKRVWIKEIGASDISFGVCLPLNQEIGDIEEEENAPKGSEPTNWYVKVNGASWMSIKRVFLEKTMDGEDEYESWDGRIYGLTPMASYHLEFVKESDQSLIYDTTLITQRAPSNETS
jgi:ubiquitination network signaling protein AcrB